MNPSKDPESVNLPLPLDLFCYEILLDDEDDESPTDPVPEGLTRRLVRILNVVGNLAFIELGRR